MAIFGQQRAYFHAYHSRIIAFILFMHLQCGQFNGGRITSFLCYLALASLYGKLGLESSLCFLTPTAGTWCWEDSKGRGWDSWHSLSISVCPYDPSMWLLQHRGPESFCMLTKVSKVWGWERRRQGGKELRKEGARKRDKEKENGRSCVAFPILAS